MTIIFLLSFLLLLSLPLCAANSPVDVPVVMTNVAESNIFQVESYLKTGGLIFDIADAAPAGAEYFFLRYKFTILENSQKSWYTLAISSGRGPGSYGQSRFSWAVDNGEVQPALRTQRIKADGEGIIEHLQMPVQISAGVHTLELRFYPDQRLRVMSRVTEAFTKHHVEIRGLGWRKTDAPAPVKHDKLAENFKLRGNDKVVLFGDSITEEEFYGRHFVRIIEAAFPASNIAVYNSGVSLNRTPEGVARIDKDVLPLKPQWAVLAFGVNDAMQIAPDDYLANSAKMTKALQDNNINALLASPSGMTPNVEVLNPTFFSMHATDRAVALDRTMARNGELLRGLAKKNKILFADVHGAFTRTSIPRTYLMNNQWHPNLEGGRMFAIALLRSLGITEEEIIRTGDARDLAYYRAIGNMAPDAGTTPLAVKSAAIPLQGTIIFGADYRDNRVIACDEKGVIKAVMPTPHHPAAIVYSKKNHEIYVGCEGAGKIQVYQLPVMRLKEEIDLGIESYPTGMAISADEKTLYIASFFGSKVIEYDIANRKVSRTFAMPNVVNNLALAADGTLLVSLPNALVFFDIANAKILSTVDTVKFTANFLCKPDGTIALINAENWEMLPIDVAARKLAKPIPAPAQTRAMAYDNKTGRLYAGDWMNNRLLTIENGKIVSDNKLPIPLMALCVEEVGGI